MRQFNKVNVFRSKSISKTKPGLALSVRQINERYVQGKPIPPAKTPIHEPKMESGINPLRRPYCDYIDVQEYNNYLEAQLNKSTALYDEKRKAFDKAMSESEKMKHEMLVEEAKKRLQGELKPL